MAATYTRQSMTMLFVFYHSFSIPIHLPAQNLYGSTITITAEVASLVVSSQLPSSDFSSSRDELDGNFDPDFVIFHPSADDILPQVDLGEDNEVTLLPYSDHSGSIHQYGDDLSLAYCDIAVSPGETYPPQDFVRSDPGQYPQGGPNMRKEENQEISSLRLSL
ncbi:hypothetical protein EDB19DRAFT_1912899 [Suillus lakei]|nr:hypothetical protein EDB19DRAFT_1912899 [Suillus lakei]